MARAAGASTCTSTSTPTRRPARTTARTGSPLIPTSSTSPTRTPTTTPSRGRTTTSSSARWRSPAGRAGLLPPRPDLSTACRGGCSYNDAGLAVQRECLRSVIREPSGLGRHTVETFDQFVTSHQIATLTITAVVVVVLSVVLKATRIGIYIRAIADNVAGSRLVGVPINRVGTGVYAVSGALSALAGSLLAAQIGLDVGGNLGVFLRALMVCILGGFNSLALALAGAVLLGVVDNMLRAGVFGALSMGTQELVVFAAIFGAVLAIN